MGAGRCADVAGGGGLQHAMTHMGENTEKWKTPEIARGESVTTGTTEKKRVRGTERNPCTARPPLTLPGSLMQTFHGTFGAPRGRRVGEKVQRREQVHTTATTGKKKEERKQHFFPFSPPFLPFFAETSPPCPLSSPIIHTTHHPHITASAASLGPAAPQASRAASAARPAACA